MISAYLSHPIRGSKGKDATREDMEENNRKAIEFANKVREVCPGIDLYVPAEHDEFVIEAFYAGVLKEHEILDIDIRIVEKRNFLIALVSDGFLSNGMRREILAAQACHKAVIYTDGDVTPILCFLEGYKN